MRNGHGIDCPSCSSDDHSALCQDMCQTAVESCLLGLFRDVKDHQNARAKLFYNLMRSGGFKSQPSLKDATIS